MLRHDGSKIVKSGWYIGHNRWLMPSFVIGDVDNDGLNDMFLHVYNPIKGFLGITLFIWNLMVMIKTIIRILHSCHHPLLIGFLNILHLL